MSAAEAKKSSRGAAVTQFGQVVIGPPGCGKTSYCHAISTLLQSLGRKVVIVNLDPANDTLPYECGINMTEFVCMEEVMTTKGLGPNGALIYCMEYLTTNIDWLLNKLRGYRGHYFIFDFPGQAELYSHHTVVRDLLSTLETAGLRLCSVYLMDAHYATEPGKYLSALVVALSSMLQLGAPAVNLLSKVDLADKYGALQMPLEFYTEVLDLDYLLDQMEDTPFTRKYNKLNKAMAGVISDYSLVSFLPISVERRDTLMAAVKAVDKANGYVYGTAEERNIQRLLSCAVGAQSDADRLGKDRDLYGGGGDEEEEDEEERLMHAYATQNPNVK